MIIRRVPLMKFTVMTGYILAMITLDQFPLSLDAPNILEGIIRIAQGHIVSGVVDSKNRFPLLACGLIKQINSRQSLGVIPPAAVTIVEEIDCMGKIGRISWFNLFGPGEKNGIARSSFI